MTEKNTARQKKRKVVNGLGNDDKNKEKIGIMKTKTKNRNNNEGKRKKSIIKDSEFIKDKSRNIG